MLLLAIFHRDSQGNRAFPVLQATHEMVEFLLVQEAVIVVVAVCMRERNDINKMHKLNQIEFDFEFATNVLTD